LDAKNKGEIKMIACCGLDCSKCEGYIATQENDDITSIKREKRYLKQGNPENTGVSGSLILEFLANCEKS